MNGSGERLSVAVNKSTLEIVKGNIVQQPDMDAIVNAANKELAPGGGVAGAIHRAAGPELWEECRKLGGCETGEAKITSAYRLPNKYVIHTVGPVYSGSLQDEKDLRSCYINSLKLAKSHGIKTIAFPAISTGIFGYPMEDAARVAIRAVVDFLMENEEIKIVRFVLFDDKSFNIHKKVLNDIIR
ncbi:MAG: O-acetyl-ADP-ribose deacetylase [Candidatus Aenigmatarchaeota archaeon]